MNKILKIGVIDVIVAILVAIALVFSFIPCDRAIFILPLLVLSYLIPVVVYRRSSYYNLWGEIALSVAFVMMTIFFTLNLWQSTVLLGSTDAPLLLHDAYFFYRLSQDIVHQALSENSPIVPYMGYPYYLSLWLLVGINDIAYPIVVNLFLLLMSLLLVGRCVCFIVGEHSSYASRMAGCAMLLTAIVPGVMVNGTVLLKESFVIVSLLLCINAFYAVKQRYRVVLYTLALLAGLLVLSLCRPTYIYVLLVYLIVIWGYKFSRHDIIPFLSILIVSILMMWVGVQTSWWGSDQYINGYIAGGGHRSFSYGESQKPLLSLMGDYNAYPVWKKVLVLPFTIGVQFLIPFPFESVPEEFGMPISGAYQRMSYLWYMVALPILLYYVLHWWRKDGNCKLSLFALASLVAYCVPAFVSGGVVSRYAFCFVPMLSVMGAYVMTHIAIYNKLQKRVSVAFTLVYVVLLMVALYVGAHPHLIM